ncbi:hypothetical protein V6N13_015611 [Hibiscus sabdariffa]|uniref:X8 domain-containing protein n=1 Tax=Hibiscus sabdariffa TaxID=183260 RepID=A0ABR2CW77_9ROSI
MAISTVSLPVFCLLLLILSFDSGIMSFPLSYVFGEMVKLWLGPFKNGKTITYHDFIPIYAGILLKLANGQGKTWCVTKPSTDDAALASNIKTACDGLGMLGLNCSLIQQSGACYQPNTLINHASVVMNYYYQVYGPQEHTCYFSNSGLITVSDPSYGSCVYK